MKSYVLEPYQVYYAQGGLYVWCRAAAGINTRELHEAALAQGVAFVPGHAFYADPAGDSELRLCFSSVAPAVIDEAMRKFAAAFPAARSSAHAKSDGATNVPRFGANARQPVRSRSAVRVASASPRRSSTAV